MTKVNDRPASILNVGPSEQMFAAPERLAKMEVGYINQYAWPDGVTYWGKPHLSRRQAETAATYAIWNGKRVVARAVVRRKKKPPVQVALAYRDLRPGTHWRHTNGRLYKIEKLTNLPDTEKYPLTVVYVGERNGRNWSRRADDWHRSMKQVYTLPPLTSTPVGRNNAWVRIHSYTSPIKPPAVDIEWDPQP